MAVNFTPLLKRLAAKGIKPNTPAARNWFRNKVRDTRVNRQKLMSASDRSEAMPKIGSMYCYAYDPKHKKTLPYYDEFPLIFVVEPAPGGFIGINLHYVSPRNRIVIMDKGKNLGKESSKGVLSGFVTGLLTLPFDLVSGFIPENDIKLTRTT